jgi:adenine-specific DNA-methyltransferase
VWKNVTDNNPTRVALEHEYIIVFAKDKDAVSKVWKSRFSAVKDMLVSAGADLIKKHKDNADLEAEYAKWFREHRQELGPLDRYRYIDREGVYTGSQSVHNPGREGYRYDVPHPVTKMPCKQPMLGYRFPPDTMQDLLSRNRIIFGEDHNKIIELKVYAKDFLEKLPSVIELDGRTAAYELREIFPDRQKAFDNPKPTQLVEKILSFVTGQESLVLDSFAGSGTTAHSVLNLNAADGGHRRFILVECEEYADDLTRERVRRIATGSKGSASDITAFTYSTLGNPIELDKILSGKSLPSFLGLGGALFHMATGRPPNPALIREEDFYLGTVGDLHVWLIYQPNLEWLKSPEAALTLARARAFAGTDPAARHLVIAPARFVSQKMLAEQNIPVEFVPLPFALYRIVRD